VIHSVELVIPGNLLDRSGLLLLKDDEVMQEVEKPLLVEESFNLFKYLCKYPPAKPGALRCEPLKAA